MHCYRETQYFFEIIRIRNHVSNMLLISGRFVEWSILSVNYGLGLMLLVEEYCTTNTYNKTVHLLKLSVSVLSVSKFLSTVSLCATCLWIGVHLRTCHQLLYWPLLLWKKDMKQIEIRIRFTASRHHDPQTYNKIRFQGWILVANFTSR